MVMKTTGANHMTPRQAAEHYFELANKPSDDVTGMPCSEAIRFAHAYEDNATEAEFTAYIDAIEQIADGRNVPALLVDSVSDLAARWSAWLDTDASYGHRR